jgi:sugar phosphate isomerase/epimerase
LLAAAAYAQDPLTPLDDLLRFARDAGLAHVQLAWEQVARSVLTSGGGLSHLHHPGLDALRERLGEAGLEPLGLDAAAFDALDDQTFERQTDDLYGQMRIAARLGAPHVTLTAGPRDPANFAHLVDALKRLTVLAERVGLGISIRNLCDSSVEQLDDLHRLFHQVGVRSLTLDLDMAAFQAAVVNPYDAAISFPGRIARVRVCDVNLSVTLAALQRDGFTGPVLVALDDGPAWAQDVARTVDRM